MYIDSDTKIQVLEAMGDLPRAEKEQCGAFIVRRICHAFHFTPPTHVAISTARRTRHGCMGRQL